MTATFEVKDQGDVHTVIVSGSLDEDALPEFSRLVAAPFGAGATGVVVDLSDVTSLVPAVLSFLYRMNDHVTARGGDVVICRPQGDIEPRPADGSAKNVLRIEHNRHVALGELLSLVGPRKRLVLLLESPCSVVCRPSGDEGRAFGLSFVRAMMNFLVFRPETADYCQSLSRGEGIVVSMTPVDGDTEYLFEAQVEKFAVLKDDPTPCVLVRVPAEVEERRIRREPVLPHELKVNFWGISGDKTPRPGVVFSLDTEGFGFRATRFDHRPGAEIFCEIDLVVTQFSGALRCRVAESEFDPMGQVVVRCEFLRLVGRDAGVLEDYLERYCSG